MAARHTLITSVASAVPAYTMQSTLLPVSVCDDIDKKCRNFLWGTTESHRRIHHVAWEDVCLSKSEGGLGIRNARKQNMAFMAKLGWGLIKRRDALWVKFVREKYRCGSDVIPLVESRKHESQTWKGIKKAWPLVKRGMGWKVGDGACVRFWEDAWVTNYEKLEVNASRVLTDEEREYSVSHYTLLHGGWDRHKLESILPGSVLQDIYRLYPNGPIGLIDVPVWRETKDGAFSIRSAYTLACGSARSSRGGYWRKIWKLKIPQRFRTFLWLCVRGRLFTNDVRASRGLGTSPNCLSCDGIRETIIHVLRDCNIASQCWLQILPSELQDTFFHISNSLVWIEWNISQVQEVDGIQWRVWFAILCRLLWMNRNAGVFEDKARGTKSLIEQMRAMVKWASPQLVEVSSPSINDKRWLAPYVGWIKVNVDGARSTVNGVAACGGIARNHNGDVLNGFIFHIGVASSLHAELWAVLWGLKQAWDSHWKKVVIETDCWDVINYIGQGWEDTHPDGDVLTQIMHLINLDWEVKVEWCNRDANMVADKLAKEALSAAGGVFFFHSAPSFLSSVLAQETYL